MMRVAVVNDLRMAVEVLRRVVLSMPDTEIAWAAEDGRQAVEFCRRDPPDLILMDMIMPVLNGVEATRQIMEDHPCPILITTANVKTNVNYVYEALGCGAVDAVNTPVMGTNGSLDGAEELIRKIRQLSRLAQPAPPCFGSAPRVPAVRPHSRSTLPPLVAIGASTGGPEALRNVLSVFRRGFPFALLIVQHLDETFVPGLVQWLERESKVPVRRAEAGQLPRAGHAWIACTDRHLVLDAEGRMQYVTKSEACIHRPSVEVLFDSLLGAPVQPGIAVLLSGMGQDGACGLKRLRDRGWETIVQDKPSSVVWGMPGAAVKLNAARKVLPLTKIGPAIQHAIRGQLRGASAEPQPKNRGLG